MNSQPPRYLRSTRMPSRIIVVFVALCCSMASTAPPVVSSFAVGATQYKYGRGGGGSTTYSGIGAAVDAVVPRGGGAHAGSSRDGATSLWATTSKTSVGTKETDSKNKKKERRPWNVFRFLRQSSRFVMPRGGADERTVSPGDVLWRPSSSSSFAFAPLDDVVMGGASSSRFDAATGTWTGEVTDANNGGFVGIRSTPNLKYDMSACRGLEIKLRDRGSSSSSSSGGGGGTRLKAGLRDNNEFNGIVWNSSFDVAKNGNSRYIRVPFQKLLPTKFARVVREDEVEFDKSNVCGIQFVYSKFEYDGALNPKFRVGDVDLQVEEIRAY